MSKTTLRIARFRVAAVSLALTAPACASDKTTGTDSTPAQVSVVSDSLPVGWIGQPLSSPVIVFVANGAGHAVAGATIAWTVVAGGGSFAPATSVTNASGRAQSVWTLGPAVGSNNNAATVMSGNFTLTLRASGVVWQQIVIGNAQACGLTTAGTAYCWGDNGSGNLGVGDSMPRFIPTKVPATLPFTQLTAAIASTCGLALGGAAYCWGSNRYGQLGDGTTTNRVSPVPAAQGLTFASLSGGGYHTCGLTPAGAAYCWGWNVSGQLGVGDTLPRSGAVAVSGGLVFKSLSAGRDHVCALTAAGVAYCWGAAVSGKLLTPTTVGGGLAFVQLHAGVARTCAVTAAGTAYCWGDNEVGGIGDGTQTARPDPTAVTGGLTFASVSTGADHSCGIASAGTAYCWGGDSWGELGNGATVNFLTAPVAVGGGLVFVSLDEGGAATCGLATSGMAYCWGENGIGTLGDGTQVNRALPVRVMTP